MIADALIRSLWRLLHLLASAFPRVARGAERAASWLRLLVTNPVTAPLWNRLVESPQGQALISVVQRFWWRDYAKDRIDSRQLPAEGVPILRPSLVLATTLCLLVPLAMHWIWPAVSQDEVPRAYGPVAGWSIVLWLVAMSLAWGGLEVGAAVSNRLSYVVVTVLFLYFVPLTALPPLAPSMWNLTLPIAVLATLALAEHRLQAARWRGLALSLATCLFIGGGVGIISLKLLPLGPILPPIRFAIGAAVGLLVVAWTRISAAGRRPGWIPKPPTSAANTWRLVSLLLVVYYGSLAVRGGLGLPATAVIEFFDLWSGYLWPVWYLIGVGLIFKLLQHTKVLTQAIRDVLPGRWLVPIALLLLLVALLVTWSGYVTDRPGLQWPSWFFTVMIWALQRSQSWYWSEPLYVFTADVMRWVLLVDLVAVIWLAVRRRLTSGAVMVILGNTLLLWFVVSQYWLKYLGFSKAGTGTPLTALVLAMLMLWLLYRAGLFRTLDSSPRWPAVGRIALYSAVVLFVMLEIHFRSAIHDENAIHRVFLYTFRGVVDFGPPYLLALWAARRLKSLPVTMPRLLVAFGLGGVAAIMLNALDKLAAAGGSWSTLVSTLTTRYELVLSGAVALAEQMVPVLPLAWTAVRGVLAAAFLAVVAVWAERRLRGRDGADAKLVFVLLAAGSGIAAFSQIQLDLPIISMRWLQLIEPYRSSLQFDAHVVALFVGYLLPALVLAVAFTGPDGRSRRQRLSGAAVAALLAGIATVLWPAHEAWLRSSGILWTVGAAAGGLFLMLLRAARLRVEASLPDDVVPRPAGSPPPLGKRTIVAIAIIAAVGLAWVARQQVSTGRLVLRSIPGIEAELPLASAWTAFEELPPTVRGAFHRGGAAMFKPVLTVALRPDSAHDIDGLLADAIAIGEQGFADFEPYGTGELWHRYLPGARALEFFFSQSLPGGGSTARIGTVAMLPLADGDVVEVLLLCDFVDHPSRRWDLVLIAESLRRQSAGDDGG